MALGDLSANIPKPSWTSFILFKSETKRGSDPYPVEPRFGLHPDEPAWTLPIRSLQPCEHLLI